MKRTIVAAGLAGLLAVFGVGAMQSAFAQTEESEVQVLPMEEIIGQLRADGYDNFREIKLKDEKYEVDAADQEGREVEIELDAQTGEILKVEDD